MRFSYQVLSLLTLCLFLILPKAGFAASSDWQDLGGGKARLVALASPENGSINGVIEIKLDKGWKTYWRSPGDSGIPPRFDFGKSKGVTIDNVMFPAPHLIDLEGDIIAGYKDQVAFPFQGSKPTDDNGEIALTMLIGVCEIICIPAKLDLKLPLQGLQVSNFQEQAILDKARLLLPQENNDEVKVQSMTLADTELLETQIAFPAAQLAPEDVQLFVEDDHVSWFKAVLATKLEEAGNGISTASFKIPFRLANDSLNVKETPLKLTLRAGEKSYELKYLMN